MIIKSSKKMTEDFYSEKLSGFKQNEKPEVVLLVADNPERIKLVIAWTNLNVGRVEKLTELKSETENELWEWLWVNTSYSRAELKETSGIGSEIALEGKMKPLIGNRVIYPDGTVNSYIQRYLREQVVKLFEAKPKRLGEKTQ
jgi:hypothetical protein